MSKTAELQQLGTDAVRQLRKNRLKSGLPFMISSVSLPSDQSYLEYPEGQIILVTYARNAQGFTELRALSTEEAISIREQFDLEFIT